MVGAGHGRGMASVNQTRPHCVNQMGKTHFKPLAARHGRGTAWARHVMCESTLKDASRGRHFRLNEEVKETVHDWLVQQPKDFVSRGIYVLAGH